MDNAGDIQEFLRQTARKVVCGNATMQETRPRVFCRDGESVSIQAGENLYSTPRTDHAKKYTRVEAGYPSYAPPESWFEYSERVSYMGVAEARKDFTRFAWHMLENAFKYKMGIKQIAGRFWRWFMSISQSPYCNDIYPYIPVEVAYDFIGEHGGIDWGKTLLGDHTEVSRRITRDFKAKWRGGE